MSLENIELTQSAISRNFMNKVSPRGDLTPDKVPGINKHVIAKLKANGVDTFDQLLGQFFQFERDESRFIEYLEDVGIPNIWARECASAMSRKYQDI